MIDSLVFFYRFCFFLSSHSENPSGTTIAIYFPPQPISTMDVTSKNFTEALSILIDKLGHANFVSIDTEFTGLYHPHTPRQSAFDTAKMRYLRAKDVAKDFPICQFGLCLFTYKREENIWETMPFNFYLCPQAFPVPRGNNSYPLIDRTFSIQASSMAFLVQNSFDFQKMFTQGISWLRKDEEEYHIELKRMKMDDAKPKPRYRNASKRDIKYIESVQQDIEVWLQTHPHDERLVIDAPRSSSLRRFVFDMIEYYFPDLSHKTIGGGGAPEPLSIMVKKMTELEKQDYKKERAEQSMIGFLRMVRHNIGFRRVIELLIESNRLVVAHNCLLDLTKVIDHFCEDLDPTLIGFKRQVRRLFPSILDTKLLMIEEEDLQNILDTSEKSATGLTESLQALYNVKEKTQEKIEFQCPGRFSRYEYDETKIPQKRELPNAGPSSETVELSFLHEAGYDALVAGKLLIEIATFLQKKEGSASAVISPSIFDFQSEFLNRYGNKIPLPNCKLHPFIDLEKENEQDSLLDLKPPLVHVSGIQGGKMVRNANILSLIEGLGLDGVVLWTDNTSLILAVRRQSATSEVDSMEMEKTNESNMNGSEISAMINSIDLNDSIPNETMLEIRERAKKNNWVAVFYHEFVANCK